MRGHGYLTICDVRPTYHAKLLIRENRFKCNFNINFLTTNSVKILGEPTLKDTYFFSFHPYKIKPSLNKWPPSTDVSPLPTTLNGGWGGGDFVLVWLHCSIARRNRTVSRMFSEVIDIAVLLNCLVLLIIAQ